MLVICELKCFNVYSFLTLNVTLFLYSNFVDFSLFGRIRLSDNYVKTIYY